ncbi:hypothetical protein VTJ04DRAFT_5237 [Mycothermus thermophilus]|uniref:uncharacterized protein n=1 Tax=Humicola insolens TaxID=85995 RepID=UPI0037437DF8
MPNPPENPIAPCTTSQQVDRVLCPYVAPLIEGVSKREEPYQGLRFGLASKSLTLAGDPLRSLWDVKHWSWAKAIPWHTPDQRLTKPPAAFIEACHKATNSCLTGTQRSVAVDCGFIGSRIVVKRPNTSRVNLGDLPEGDRISARENTGDGKARINNNGNGREENQVL